MILPLLFAATCAFGGWSDGPQLRATGNFRTEKVDGKWWFVDPCGHLFFSLGVQAVMRKPENDGNRAYFESVTNRYGSLGAASADIAARLKTWGINTIGPWSNLVKTNGVPYCGHLWTRGPVIAGSNGWWGKFRDPFSREFRDAIFADAQQQVNGWGAPSGTDPYCIGYFVDNEMNWSGDDRELARAVLRSPADQPAKRAFMTELKIRYLTPQALSERWGVPYADWDAFLASTNVPVDSVAGEDLLRFERNLVAAYFSTVRAAIKRAMPDKLFLGSRIAWGGETPLRECARQADVVSVNTYRYGPRIDLPPGSDDKPMLVSEFQFCVREGEFTKCGMLEATNRADRAHCYREYVRACLEHPRYVGAHWFQWLDSPPGAKGENGWIAQSGLVNGDDEPYTETVAAIRAVADEMYRYRATPSVVPLQTWERVEGNVHYIDQPGTHRVWGGENNAKTFVHSLGTGRTYSSGRIVVRKDRWTKGTVHVEVSNDGADWLRLGEPVKGEFFECGLPRRVFPAERLHVRFVGDEGCSYELNGYALDLEFEGAQLWQAGSDNPFYRDIRGEWLDPYSWTCSSNRKVPRFGRPDRRGKKAKALRLALAANETEAVQLVLSPQADMRNVRVEVALDGLEAEVLEVDWRRITHPTDTSGATGFWPDPIRRQVPSGVFIPRGSNRGFWIRVKAPKGTAKGVYRGMVRMREAGDEGKARSYPLEVRVFGFELPDESAVKTNFGFDAGKIRAFGGDPDEWQRALDAHRMTRFGRHGYRYVFDEPGTNQYPEVRRLCEESRARHPDLKRLVTEPPCKELEGFVDIWCPRTDDYDAAAAAACRARGESYWWYVCCGPKAPYAGLFVDRPGHELRLWLWQTWAEGIDGVLIWHTHWLSKARDDTGDGTFFYPDANGRPVDTVRAEAFRDGVEDYEYFATLKRLDPGNPLLAVPRDVFVSLTEFNRDPAALEAHRIRLGLEIERKME